MKYPIIQSGTADALSRRWRRLSGNAVGLGIMGAQIMSADEARKAIRLMRDLTDKSFGVNVLSYYP
jgi:enoyl-[acyl-carrier protein] reductase II